MPRLFVPNFGFEEEIAGHSLSRSASEATRGLIGCWDAVLGPTDAVCPIPYTRPQAVLTDCSEPWEIVPWGWSRPMVRWANSICPVVSCPDPSVVEMLNRRRWGFAREKDIEMAPRGSAVVESVEACVRLLSKPASEGLGWIVKADLGSSGRGQRRFGSGEMTNEFVTWVSSRLTRYGMVQVEPVLPSVREVGVQYDVQAGGEVVLCGITELLTTDSGAYRGTRIFRCGEETVQGLGRLVEMLEPVAEQVAETGYSGPLGVDSMQFQSDELGEGWRPVQDVNARFTMGRCALEWSTELPVGTRGTVLAASWGSAESVDRRVASLPEKVAGLRNALRFSPPESPPTTGAGLVLLVYDKEGDALEIEAAALRAIQESTDT
ncbi:MAG TPA: hypothetical protein DCE43_22900 [Planctomycetaceae bacterium]|nr:hypothetical protein [Planctomycetaceae bacterium]